MTGPIKSRPAGGAVNPYLTTRRLRWRMRFLIICLLFLSACNTAGPHFRGLPATQVSIDGSTFDVRVRGEMAEAIRTNTQYAPRFGPIRDRAGQAMAQVSGCEVREVRGDQAQAIGILKCGNAGPKPIPAVPVDLECAPIPGTATKELGGVSVLIECDPIL